MKRHYALMTAAVLCGSLAFWGCKNGNLFGGFHEKGTGDPESLLSDAKTALANREYNNAKAYYEQILQTQPTNSEALYGAATATMGTAGLDLGTLLANVITAKSAAPGLQQAIQYASFAPAGAGITQDEINSLSILKGVDLSNLSGSVDQIVCFLMKIRSGNADGKISPKDISVLMSVGITCIIRGILRPLEVGVIDLQQTADGKDYNVVILNANKLKDICSDNTLKNSLLDLAGALQSVQTAVQELKSQEGSTLSGLSLDMKDALSQFKTKVLAKLNEVNSDGDSTNNVPTECINFVQNFNIDNLTPPTADPGNCLDKSNKPLH